MSGVHHLFRFISYKRKKKKKRWMPLCSPHCQHRIPLKTRKKTLVNTESTNEKRGRKRAMLLLYGTQHVPHTFVWTWKRRPGVSIFHQPSHNSFEPLAGPTALEKSFFSPLSHLTILVCSQVVAVVVVGMDLFTAKDSTNNKRMSMLTWSTIALTPRPLASSTSHSRLC